VKRSTLQQKTDDELFQIDFKGDDKSEEIRKSYPFQILMTRHCLVRDSLPNYRFSTSKLTSTKILSQRSAIPAVFSRHSSVAKRKRSTVTHEEKGRLLQIAKRQRRGPFNAVMAPEENVMELSETVKRSGGYDPWEQGEDAQEENDGLEGVRKRPVKVPKASFSKLSFDWP
jgi:nucleolar protein 53